MTINSLKRIKLFRFLELAREKNQTLAPIAVKLGYDPLAFAIIGIIAIEAGLLTPPFGLLVYTVKSAIHGLDPTVNVMTIFKSSTPYWILMLIGMVLIIVFPEIATILPKLLF